MVFLFFDFISPQLNFDRQYRLLDLDSFNLIFGSVPDSLSKYYLCLDVFGAAGGSKIGEP